MPDIPPPQPPVRPYVHETLAGRALHFSINAIQSSMLLADPDALALLYTRTMMGLLLFKPQPRQIAMIGLGGGSLVKFCHRHLPDTVLQVVEINPHVIALRQQFQVPPDGPRLQVLQADGARFVREAARGDRPALEVLMVDGFDGDGQPEALSTPAFYDDCLDALQPGGLLVVNLHSADPKFDVLVQRLERSFNPNLLLVDDGELSNTIIFASKGQALAMAVRRGLLGRRPKGLSAAAAQQLADGFELVAKAWQARPRR